MADHPLAHDFSSLRGVRAMHALAGELRQNGWATLRLDAVLRDLYAGMVEGADWFFDQPLDVKAAVDIRSSLGHRGWVPPDEAGNYADEIERRYEAFDIGREPRTTDATHHPLRGTNRWPAGPGGAAMSQHARALFAALSALALELGDAICDDLLVPRATLRNLRREPVSQLRLIRYFNDDVIRLSSNAVEAAMGAHTDYEFFTFLYQTSPGTQVLGDDGHWTDVPCQDVVTVLVGDMLDVFSNGTYRSAMHRAAATVAPGRVSLPFFVGADFDVIVSPAVAGPRTHGVKFGEHLMRQLGRDFPYLRSGGTESPHRSAFELQAIHRSQLGHAHKS